MVYRFRLINRDIILVFILYSLSHGMILLNQGIYWDDWVLYNVDKKIIIDTFRQAGVPWTGYFHNFMLSLKYSVFSYHLLVFLAYFMAAVFLYNLLKKIDGIGNIPRLFITILFAIFPVNSARIAFIDSPYALCYFAFFFGFFLLDKFLDTSKNIYRISALIMLFFSLFTNSLLMFYTIIFLYIVYVKRDRIKDIVSFLKLLIKYLDFLILPFLFWIIKIKFFIPSKLYSGYNNLEFAGLIKAPLLVMLSLYTSFFQVINNISFGVLFLGVILGVSFIWFFNITSDSSDSSDSIKYDGKHCFFISLGIIFFILAVFPYNAIGLVPANTDWNSRHQLLTPLGASFILYFVTMIFMKNFEINNKIQILFFSVFIALFSITNINSYIAYQKDWYKQVSIIENFKNNNVIKNNTTFVFDDHCFELNANKRTYRLYEYSGFMKEAFRDETRFGVDTSLFYNDYSGDINLFKHFMNAYYNLGSYKIKNPEYLIEINYGKIDINDPINCLRLVFYERFNSVKYYKLVSQITVINSKKIEY